MYPARGCVYLTAFVRFFSATAPPPLPVGQVFHILEVSGSHTQRRTTVSSTPLDEWSARRRDPYLKTRTTITTDIHASAEFEPTISAGERSQTYALDRATTGTGSIFWWPSEYRYFEMYKNVPVSWSRNLFYWMCCGKVAQKFFNIFVLLVIIYIYIYISEHFHIVSRWGVLHTPFFYVIPVWNNSSICSLLLPVWIL